MTRPRTPAEHGNAGGSGLHFSRLRVSRRAFALDVADLDLPAGMTVLAGPNGAGKTTMLLALAGRIAAQEKEASLNGTPVSDLRIGLMPQSPDLPRDLTPFELLAQIAWLEGSGRREAQSQAESTLETLDLAQHADTRITQLSGGMRRRLAFGACLAVKPDVALLDEPTNDLDPHQRSRLLADVSHLAADRPVVVSSHALRDVASIADTIIVLDSGRVLHSGSVPAFIERYAPSSGDPEDAYTACIDSHAGTTA